MKRTFDIQCLVLTGGGNVKFSIYTGCIAHDWHERLEYMYSAYYIHDWHERLAAVEKGKVLPVDASTLEEFLEVRAV